MRVDSAGLAAGFSLAATLLAASPPELRAEDSFTPRTTFAYTPLQVWDPATVGRLGVKTGAIYRIGTQDPDGKILDLHVPYEARHASIAPDCARLAFLGTAGLDPTQRYDGVYVADSSGTILASFPGAVGYRWSPDGSLLAVWFSRADSATTTHEGGLLLWTNAGRSHSVRLWVDDVYWTSETRLTAQDGAYVREVDLGTPAGRREPVIGTPRAGGVNLSPDGRYSIRTGRNWKHPSVVDEATGADVAACATASLREALPADPGGERKIRFRLEWDPDIHLPYWVRLPGAGHLLCVTVCGGEPVAGVPAPAGCRAVIVDVESNELVASYPGYALGPSADQHGVMRLTPQDRIEIGDVFLATAAYRVVDRHRTRAQLAQNATVGVELFEVRALGRLRERVRIRTRRLTALAGDWLPSLLPGPGLCDREFRVDRIPSAGRVIVHYDGRKWIRARSGGVAISDDHSSNAEAIVMNEGLTFVPRYGPGGHEVRLWTMQAP